MPGGPTTLTTHPRRHRLDEESGDGAISQLRPTNAAALRSTGFARTIVDISRRAGHRLIRAFDVHHSVG